MPRRRNSDAAADSSVVDYRHDATRKNNPPAGLASQGRIAERPVERYAYNPHLPPVLRFDGDGAADRYPELLAEARRRPLTDDETRLLAEALRTQEPWLEWAGTQRWVSAVNAWGKLGRWSFHVCRDPAMLDRELRYLLQPGNGLGDAAK